MKILFDHNMPWGLRWSLKQHDLSRAADLGWAELVNGMLLTAAEKAGFDLFLTGDQNIRYQQNLSRRRIAIVELTTVHWRSVQHCIPGILEAIDESAPGSYQVLPCAYRGSRYRRSRGEVS